MLKQQAVLALFSLLLGAATPPVFAHKTIASSHSSVRFTGTYLTKDKSCTQGIPEKVVVQPSFLCQQLPGNRLRFLVHTMCGGIHNDHEANLEGTAKRYGNEAIFKKGSYVLNIKFRPGAVVLSEKGNPDDLEGCFGEGASATGIYLLKSAESPNFRQAEEKWEIEAIDPD